MKISPYKLKIHRINENSPYKLQNHQYKIKLKLLK